MKKHPVKQTTERRVSATLRIAMAVILLLLNIASVILLTVFLQVHAAIAFAVLEIIAIAVAVNIQSSPVSASYKLAWTLLVVALPVAGMVLYVLWGGNIQSKRLNLLPTPPPQSRESERRQSQLSQERLNRLLPNWRRAAQLLYRRDFLIYQDTRVTYFPTGRDFFDDAIARMEKAERFILLEYFILAEGRLWDRMLEVLTERARQGVEIKIIFDDFGNITRMRGETIEQMQADGMEVRIFNPVHQYVNRLYFNYRDHRKILCVDGQYAYTGGVNVADEYVGIVRRFGEWKDGGVLLDGPGESDGFCQPFTDGPMNNPDNPAEDLYLRCITSANTSVWMTTPYFAVEDSVVQALCIAADSGVDVRLLLPGIPDHRYTDIVAGSYFERLLRHGVKIYRFTPGFLHAKSLTADGEMALVGTVNMDYRSFQLHCECGVALYGAPCIRDLIADMEEIMARSMQVEAGAWAKRPWLRRALEKVLRVFSIWM